MNLKIKISEHTENSDKIECLKIAFSDFFSRKGYLTIPPKQITTREDHTVQFIGSSTNAFKKNLLQGCDDFLFTVQPCFRARNIDELLDDHSQFKWGSLFTMFGTIGNPKSYIKQSQDIFQFLMVEIGIPPEELCLQVHHDDEHLLVHWKEINGLNFEISKQPDSYYRWKYGEKGIYGKGVSLALISKKNSKPQELGNIIEVYKYNQVIAIEMGFGLECLLTRLEDKDHTIESTSLASLFDLTSNHQKKYADAVMVSMTLIQNGVKPSARGQGRVLREYINGIVYFVLKLSIPQHQVVNNLLQVEKNLQQKHTGIAAKLFNYIFDSIEEINEKHTNIAIKTNEQIAQILRKK